MNDFKSLLMGGFECSDHINRSGQRVDMLRETGHLEHVREDYRSLSELGIKTVREGICWSKAECGSCRYDFSGVFSRIQAANEFGMQVIWDICHFGYPDDLMPTHPKFPERFAAVCFAFAQYHREHCNAPAIIIPINEISFLAWHSGEMRGTVPFAINSGFDIKYHLCKAAIAGVNAIRLADPEARIMVVEPLICIHPVPGADPSESARLNEEQFQAIDIIGGRLCPELGGKPENLEMLGFNYYHNNQWVHQGKTLCWLEDRHQCSPLSLLLHMAYVRYKCPIVLAETGHFGNNKREWIEFITEEYIAALKMGADLRGLCIYPVIDRPDWDDLVSYSNCGMWAIDAQKNRIADRSYIEAIIKCRHETEIWQAPVFHSSGRAVAST
jgi:beta-glucosidase/6-phospho-beta-glucosidase/beta-galactosidase